MRASLRSQPGGSGSAAGSSFLAQVGSSLLAQPCWIDEHAPGVQQLRVSAPVISPGKQHATRSLSAVVTTPLGTKRPASATVDYTLPPEGEPASAAKRRDDRHRRREERAIRSMDFSEAAQAHAEAEAERKSSARDEGNQLLVQLPVDVPPYGLSAELLLSAAWITRQLPLIEPGSLVVGELKLVDERALRVRELQMPCGVCGWANTHGNMGCRSKCRPMSAEERRPLEDGIRRIDEGKDPAFSAFRNIRVIVDDAHFRPFCSSNTFPSSISEFCGAPLQLMTIASDAFGVGPSTEAVMAAWLAHGISPPYSDRDDGYYEHLAQFYNAVYGDTATGDSSNFPNKAVVSSLTASKTCAQCKGDVPDVAVRWRCDACDFDCCLACGTSQQEDGLSTAVGYDLPPAAGESQAESNRRRERHRKREEAAIRDLHRWCAFERESSTGSSLAGAAGVSRQGRTKM